ncbi:MAG: response regulator [bacterium]|nr:response regulator [bacterium]
MPSDVPDRRDGAARVSAGSPFSGDEIACRPLGFFISELERQGHSADILLDGLGLTRDDINSFHGRIDWESSRRMWTNLRSVWSDDDFVAAGRRMVRSRWIQPFFAIARLIFTTSDLYRWVFEPDVGFARHLITCIHNDIRRAAPGKLRIERRMQAGYRPSRELFLIMRGQLIGLPCLLGQPKARVDMQLIDDGAVFDVTYSRRIGLRARLRRLRAWPSFTGAANRELHDARDELFDHARRIAVEIDVRKAAEAALLESDRRFVEVFEAAPVPVVISTFDGVLKDVNESFIQLAGYPREVLVGKNTARMNMWHDRAVRADMVDRVRRGESVRGVETRFNVGDGGLRDVVLSAVGIRFGGEPCIIWQATDLTENKRAEGETRRLEERVLQTQKLESLGALAGGIAHDFNNLLVGVMGNAELALEELESHPERLRSRLEAMLVASRDGVGLTRRMLSCAGMTEPSKERFDLATLAESSAMMVRSTLSGDVKIECRLGVEPMWVDGDESEVRQALLNVLTNAAEAHGDDSGTVEIRTDRVHVDAEYLSGTYLAQPLEEGDYILLEIRDSGCGMDPQTLKKIFDPFFTTKFAGRGLGLAVTLGIVTSHGGTLKVESDPGRGTTFQVLFPYAAEATDRAEIVTPERDAREGVVLVIDDERSVREVAEAMLERCGHRAICATGGAEAVELLVANRDDVALALLDLTMPGIGGTETFRLLREIRPELPIICCSGHGEQTGRRLIEGKSAAQFLAKPFSLDDLRTALDRVFSGASRTT